MAALRPPKTSKPPWVGGGGGGRAECRSPSRRPMRRRSTPPSSAPRAAAAAAAARRAPRRPPAPAAAAASAAAASPPSAAVLCPTATKLPTRCCARSMRRSSSGSCSRSSMPVRPMARSGISRSSYGLRCRRRRRHHHHHHDHHLHHHHLHRRLTSTRRPAERPHRPRVGCPLDQRAAARRGRQGSRVRPHRQGAPPPARRRPRLHSARRSTWPPGA